MHRAVILLLLARSSAPISLPCGLFIIYIFLPQTPETSCSFLCGGHERDTVLVQCERLRVCLCVCKHVIHGD